MIFEDPDELGYWTGLRPSIDICNDIIPKYQRDCIVSAAINAHEGHHAGAEDERRKGRYDGPAVAALGQYRG